MMGSVRIGEMDIRIIIQSVSTANNALTNQEEKTFSTLATVWAKRLGPKSTEGFEADQQVAVSDVRYMIRRRTDLRETYRVIDGSNTYEIKGIEDFGRAGDYMIITCEKRDNG